MKSLLLLGLCWTLPALGDSIVPERIVTPLLELRAPVRDQLDGQVSVKMLSITPDGDLLQTGERANVKRELYEFLSKASEGVYEVVNSDKLASAVHLREGLVLTNHHVLTDMGRRPPVCGEFRLKDKRTNWFIQCQRVLFCSPEDDICLVEMGEFYRRRQRVSLNDLEGPKLTLDVTWDDSAVTTAIGNTLGLGLYASQGRGLRFFNPDIAFYAPTATGNSGGALLNDQGELIGIVKSGTVLKISSDPILSFNLATGAPRIIELARERLAGDPESLGKFNRSIAE